MSRPVWSWIQSVIPASGELLRDLDVVASVGDVQGAAHVVWRASRIGRGSSPVTPLTLLRTYFVTYSEDSSPRLPGNAVHRRQVTA
ncbi:hypothetical protein [Streptomyces sp. NPDC005525]|uniref:hypothetical protein n=1 Tax=Streptomyces sp. NPDC005525 TaxID=3364720 RepID=UPI0036B35963